MMQFADIVQFHGHSCPGLAIGYRMALAAMEALGVTRAADEELVAVVENNACGVDALQMLTGCTFGKGNLIFHDFGKAVYTLYSRSSGKGVRVLYNPAALPQELADDREGKLDFILGAPTGEILTVSMVTSAAPERAAIFATLSCDNCGEPVMETRIRNIRGKTVCIPCAAVATVQASE